MQSFILLLTIVFSFGQAVFFVNLLDKKQIQTPTMFLLMFLINTGFALFCLRLLGKL
jgi:hypothetical protein